MYSHDKKVLMAVVKERNKKHFVHKAPQWAKDEWTHSMGYVLGSRTRKLT